MRRWSPPVRERVAPARGVALASLNKKFLMGKAIDAKLEDSVRDLVAARPAVERVQGVQSRWER